MDRKNVRLILVNVMFVIALIIVVFPLLLVAGYNYPLADDWSYGTLGYHALKNGEGFFGVIRASLTTVKSSYVSWEGRFVNSFFASLQPGIWGERYYGVVAWLMIGIVIVSELYLCNTLLKKYAKEKAVWLSIPIMVPSLMLQFLYSPAPEENIYWYTGAVNYTFVYGLSLILLALFLKLGSDEYKRGVYIWRAAVACILAILVGGDNYSTSLSSFLTLFFLSALFLFFDRRAFYRTWFVTAIVGISLLICIAAPGNMVRLNGSYGGVIGKKQAIWMSLQYSLRTFYTESFKIRIALLILLILPFLWRAVKSMEFSFRFPALFTVMTFCLYASQLTPTMYVEKGVYSGRLMGILFFSYHVWLVGNVGYWVGWLSRRTNKMMETLGRIWGRLDKYLLVYCVLMALLFAREIDRSGGGRSRHTYQSWKAGQPQQYAKEWEERLAVLHDDSVKEVCFPPLSVNPIMKYTDLQPEDGYIWVNSACAQYYDKDEIRVVVPEE